ncbi:unnamed protein product [Owenia fusiformis]|uniref:Uncharacterized protein n=1 Tax=Owenia fusiformis TaxID=6347 RepID=A0A8J1TDI4_OWEFU|nr:unnamed protein product [Owenia fusiformis]
MEGVNATLAHPHQLPSVINTTMATNFTQDDLHSFLTDKLGPRRRPMPEVISLTFVYTLILVTGVIGNVCTCLVITRNHYMQTATNYYLFSLAISDVLTLILGLPPELYSIWEAYPYVFGEPFCIFKTFVSETTSYASILTITAFTIERYIAICHPIRSHTMSNLPRVVRIIVILWGIACVFALPYAIHTRTFYFLAIPGTATDTYFGVPIQSSLQCNILPVWISRIKYMFQITTFLFFFAPMTLISILYILIGIQLRKSGKRLGQRKNESFNSNCGKAQKQSRRTVLKMLVAVVVAFFVCWAPFHAQRLMTTYVDVWTPKLIDAQSTLFYISGVLYFVSSTVNPILYNLMSKKYRQAFRDTLCKCFISRNQRAISRLERTGTYFASNNRESEYVRREGGGSNNGNTPRLTRLYSNDTDDPPNVPPTTTFVNYSAINGQSPQTLPLNSDHRQNDYSPWSETIGMATHKQNGAKIQLVTAPDGKPKYNGTFV